MGVAFLRSYRLGKRIFTHFYLLFGLKVYIVAGKRDKSPFNFSLLDGLLFF